MSFVHAIQHYQRTAFTIHVNLKIRDYKGSAYLLPPLDARELFLIGFEKPSLGAFLLTENRFLNHAVK